MIMSDHSDEDAEGRAAAPDATTSTTPWDTKSSDMTHGVITDASGRTTRIKRDAAGQWVTEAEVHTYRLTWMPVGKVEWAHGGDHALFPDGSSSVRIECWLVGWPWPYHKEPSLWLEKYGVPGDTLTLPREVRVEISNG